LANSTRPWPRPVPARVPIVNEERSLFFTIFTIFTRVGTYIQRGSKFCFVGVLLVLLLGATLVRIHYGPISPCFQHIAPMPSNLARQPCPAALSCSLGRQPCPAALPGSLARQSCTTVLPGSLARQPLIIITSLITGRRPAELQAFLCP
jgi:hypothetical protein